MVAVPDADTPSPPVVDPLTDTGATIVPPPPDSSLFKGVQNEAGLAEPIPLRKFAAVQVTPTGKESVSRVQSCGFVPSRVKMATPVSIKTVGAGWVGEASESPYGNEIWCASLETRVIID
jgi:hypothetical protein